MPKSKRITKPMNDTDFEAFIRNLLETHGNVEPGDEMDDAVTGARIICDELGLYQDDEQAAAV